MKTTVEIADPLFEQAKALATQDGVSFRVLVEEGLRAVVAARTRAASKPFRLRDGSFRKGHGLQPGVTWQDLTALAYQEDNGSAKR
ncbi:MAG: DUF2191 domain-containing protein [Acidobacteria bacterium]|nr:DUF2191 domain-containing protein [Acidobacteriota bacterium]